MKIYIIKSSIKQIKSKFLSSSFLNNINLLFNIYDSSSFLRLLLSKILIWHSSGPVFINGITISMILILLLLNLTSHNCILLAFKFFSFKSFSSTVTGKEIFLQIMNRLFFVAHASHQITKHRFSNFGPCNRFLCLLILLSFVLFIDSGQVVSTSNFVENSRSIVLNVLLLLSFLILLRLFFGLFFSFPRFSGCDHFLKLSLISLVCKIINF